MVHESACKTAEFTFWLHAQRIQAHDGKPSRPPTPREIIAIYDNNSAEEGSNYTIFKNRKRASQQFQPFYPRSH